MLRIMKCYSERKIYFATLNRRNGKLRNVYIDLRINFLFSPRDVADQKKCSFFIFFLYLFKYFVIIINNTSHKNYF